jgi:hypothetical protein
MRDASYQCGPWPKPGPTLGLVAQLLPAANPDFETVYREEVCFWWFEIDEEGQVQREIGFNAGMEPRCIAPFRENFGIFTDLEGHPTPLGPAVDATAFEQAWNTLERRLAEGAS